MVSDGEEGKDRGSALRGSFERSKAGAGHENKAGKMVEMRKQHGGKVRAQTVGVVDERSEIAACYRRWSRWTRSAVRMIWRRFAM